MEWYWIVLLTITGAQLINTIFFSILDEEPAVYVACGWVWFIGYALFYPVRAIRTYNSSSGYYQKHGVSKIAFLFGKRVRHNDD